MKSTHAQLWVIYPRYRAVRTREVLNRALGWCMCAPFFRFVLTRGWSTRTLTYRKSLITTGSSVSRLMERFCLRQRLWINVFVLTTAYWICQVRTLKERKYQLPVGIFGLRQRLLHATASAFAYSLFGRKSHAYGSPRCKCPNRVNVFFQFTR